MREIRPVPACVRIGMVDRCLKLRGNILIEGSAERHVDHLCAAADAERRFAVGDSLAHQREFGAVAQCIDDAERGERRLAVMTRLNVAAACQQDAVDPFIQSAQRCLVVDGWDQERRAANRSYSVNICLTMPD